MHGKPLTFVVISILTVMLIYGPSSAFGVPNRSNEPGTHCYATGNKVGPTGSQEMECCWTEVVPPGTGRGGSNLELYCSTCQNGGTRGMINCSDPELQFRSTRGPFALPGLPSAPLGGIFQSQPSGPAIPPGGGVLQTEPNTTSSGPVVPPGNVGTLEEQIAPGGINNPQIGGTLDTLQSTNDGVTGVPPPANGGTETPTLTGETAPICPEGQVLDGRTGLCVPEEPNESEDETEQQSSEEDSSEDNNNNDNDDDN
jgi:hypothetical protein